MNTAIITLYHENYQPLADLVLPNWEEYASRHGYRLMPYLGHYHDPKWAIGFQKTKLVHDTLCAADPKIDCALVLDLDILFTNLTIKIESFLNDDHDFFIHKFFGEFNGGSYIVRRSDWSERWLRFIYEKEPEYRNDCWTEQRVMIHNENNPLFKDKIKVLPFPGINTLAYDRYPNRDHVGKPGEFAKGNFILHLAGFNLKERLDILGSKEIQETIIK